MLRRSLGVAPFASAFMLLSRAMAQPAGKIPLSIGFVNFSGEDLAPLAREDSSVLSPLFARSTSPPVGKIPAANVLFVYAHLNSDGTIKGLTSVGIRQVAQATKAAIVVLASENPSDALVKAGGFPGPKSANIVLTTNRNGPGFSRFFRMLFERMRDGEDMLRAWVEIAPQSPTQDPSQPGTILLAEAGRLAFPK